MLREFPEGSIKLPQMIRLKVISFGCLARFSGPGSAKIELLGSKTSSYMPTRAPLVPLRVQTPGLLKLCHENSSYFSSIFASAGELPRRGEKNQMLCVFNRFPMIFIDFQ